jgi:peroxiredoxin
MIKIGDVAPDFTLKTQDGKDWTLSAHKGETVVLLWYPLDWSPTCEREHCTVSTEKTLYGPNRVVVGISRDSAYSHKAFKEARRIGHELLADPMLEVTKQYGLEHPKVPFISQRATVIVDKEGKVAFVQVQEQTGDPRDMAPVRAALKQLT